MLCFFICVVLFFCVLLFCLRFVFLFAMCFFVCVLYFCLRCAFLRAFSFFVRRCVLFCLRFLYFFDDVFFFVCFFYFCLCNVLLDHKFFLKKGSSQHSNRREIALHVGRTKSRRHLVAVGGKQGTGNNIANNKQQTVPHGGIWNVFIEGRTSYGSLFRFCIITRR